MFIKGIKQDGYQMMKIFSINYVKSGWNVENVSQAKDKQRKCYNVIRSEVIDCLGPISWKLSEIGMLHRKYILQNLYIISI